MSKEELEKERFNEKYGELVSKNYPGWHLLMKANGSDFEFNHPCWTTKKLQNDHDLNEDRGSCCKYETFNIMKL